MKEQKPLNDSTGEIEQRQERSYHEASEKATKEAEEATYTLNQEHVEKLNEGVEAWNQWRRENPDITPELCGVDLRKRVLKKVNLQEALLGEADLREADLSEADLCGASLTLAKLQKANLSNTKFQKLQKNGRGWDQETNLGEAKLQKAKLFNANLEGAHLERAKLQGAYLCGANLEGAFLNDANLERGDLMAANLKNAVLNGTNLEGANVFGIKYNSKSTPETLVHYRGTRVDSCFGDPLFKRFVQDQTYLEAFRRQKPRWLFDLWWYSSYCGQSITLLALWAINFVIWFGCIYDWFDLLDSILRSRFTSFYFSIVTFTTLGFGDVTPSGLAGEIVVAVEVIFGYLALGLLVSAFANLVLRRS